MSSIDSRFSTIVVFDKHRGQNKTLVVKTKHINRIKLYVASAILLFGLMIVSIGVAISVNKRNEIEKRALTQRVRELNNLLPIPSDTTRAKNYIQNIELKLKKINKYLRQRGVKGFTTKSVGGNDDDALNLSTSEIYEFYDDHLDKVLASLAYTPVGYPSRTVVSSSFGYRNDPFHSTGADFHPGIDFKGRHGEVVRSTAFGKVLRAGWYNGYGNCVIIQHRNGYETLYGHLSKIGVKTGDKIGANQVIGNIGSTGRSTGAHLHYEVRRNNKPVNPINFLNVN